MCSASAIVLQCVLCGTTGNGVEYRPDPQHMICEGCFASFTLSIKQFEVWSSCCVTPEARSAAEDAFLAMLRAAAGAAFVELVNSDCGFDPSRMFQIACENTVSAMRGASEDSTQIPEG
jgi:hypothetical protein